MHQFITGDCLDIMREMPERSVDLTITSPPYEDARLYGMGFKLKGQAWVDWLIPRVVEMCRVTDGLVFVNAAGKVRKWSYSPVMEWLVADLTRQHGIVCGPAPYVFHRIGIPGSGSKHYQRRDWEPVYAFCLPDRLPVKWSNNTAFGKPPKWAPGGEMSYREANGNRRNQWGGTAATVERKQSGRRGSKGGRTSHITAVKLHTKTRPDGTMELQGYHVPVISNPGNVIKCNVGGGQMGSPFAHESEAPFPESLVERPISWFCHPGGTVLDPFSGSGTTVCTAKRLGRNGVGIELREEQNEVARKRLATVDRPLFAE